MAWAMWESRSLPKWSSCLLTSARLFVFRSTFSPSICKEMVLCPFPFTVPELGFLSPVPFFLLMFLLIKVPVKYSKVHPASQLGLMTFQYVSPSLDPGTEYFCHWTSLLYVPALSTSPPSKRTITLTSCSTDDLGSKHVSLHVFRNRVPGLQGTSICPSWLPVIKSEKSRYYGDKGEVGQSGCSRLWLL